MSADAFRIKEKGRLGIEDVERLRAKYDMARLEAEAGEDGWIYVFFGPDVTDVSEHFIKGFFNKAVSGTRFGFGRSLDGAISIWNRGFYFFVLDNQVTDKVFAQVHHTARNLNMIEWGTKKPEML